MAETMKPRGISLAAAFFCVLAAGCASVRGALLLLEMTAVQLLLGLCLFRLLRQHFPLQPRQKFFLIRQCVSADRLNRFFQ